jgi:hypothetical protein
VTRETFKAEDDLESWTKILDGLIKAQIMEFHDLQVCPASVSICCTWPSQLSRPVMIKYILIAFPKS